MPQVRENAYGGKRVHIVPTSLDREQVGYLFDEFAADRVIILDNEDPKGLEGIEGLPIRRTVQAVSERTRCFATNDVEYESTDFYQFENALPDVFRIIYREGLKGNDVIVNLAGGTKPVAIALSFASSLANAGRLFYTAKSYTEGSEGEAAASPVPGEPISTPFVSTPLLILNLNNEVPTQEQEQLFLIGLWNANEPMGVRDLLVSMDLISEEPPAEEEKKEERTRTIQRYHRYASNLVDGGFCIKKDSVYELTETGKQISEIVEIMREVEKEVNSQEN